MTPGTVLDGKYEILTRIGAGGMGEVFKARHLHLDTFRCIKVMKQALIADDVFRTRFVREARLATQIHHPNIAAVHDFFIGDGGNYMVTEFIDGTTVRQWSAAHGPFPPALAADVMSQVLGGLDHIHRRGLLHRDISPDNVMLSYDADERLIAKIIDLGIAKDVNSSASDTTQVGVLIGNPKYMSPEQLGALADGEQVDERADLYCAGVVLYEMLLGVPAFQSETPHGYIMKHLTQRPRAFAEVRPAMALPSGLEDVIFRTIEKDRDKRYSSARELANALAAFLAAPPGTLTRTDVARLRRGDDTTVATLLPTLSSEEATIAETPQGTDAARLAREAEDAFQRAWEDGRTSAWREFIERYPASLRAEDAGRLLEEAAAFEAAHENDSDTAFRKFLEQWPDGRHRLEAEIRLSAAKQRVIDNAFEQAIAANTYAALRDFLVRYPVSTHGEEAKNAAVERLAFETADAADSEEAWELYLAKFDSDEARERRDRAVARETEAFEEAAKEKTAAAWSRFLARHPDGRRAARAELHRREALAFEEARSGGRAELQEFLRMHGNGPHARDAQRLLRKLADEDDFEDARRRNTPAAWRLYLTTHPSGAHADAARERLTAVEDAVYANVLASRDPSAARQFLADFAHSPRAQELSRLAAKWEESAAAQSALDAIARGDCDAAEGLLARIRDAERRAEIETALEGARDRQSWDAAQRGGAAELWSYLEQRPSGRWASEARRKLGRLQEAAKASEPRDWDRAWESGTAAAWDEYLRAHPESLRLRDAEECRHEAADFELAVATNTPAMWRAFLRTWPNGRHRIDAAIRSKSGR